MSRQPVHQIVSEPATSLRPVNISLRIAVALAAYLVVVLVFPERF